MDHRAHTVSEATEFPFEPPSGAWYDRPADTALLEPAGNPGSEAVVAPHEGAASVVSESGPQAEAPSDWEQLYDGGLDPTAELPHDATRVTDGAGCDGRPVEQPSLESRLRPPALPEGLGINPAVLEDIVLRQIVVDVRNNTTAIADKLHLSANLVDVVVQTMRDRNLVEYQGMDGRSYVVGPTEAGRNHANQRSTECRYMGPVPVSLALYTEVVRSQHPSLHLDRQILSDAFGDLVIAPDLLDELGPAIHGDGAMFLYGPPGTGKSSVAERIVRAHHDHVLIPYCFEVEGQIVTVHDPTLHTAIEHQPPGLDPRWVACERPAVIAGGELHAGMLDLALEADSGVYLAPLQLKANNGIFVIDDFGRQSASPEELLNRWIVPLDRGIDYLTLMGRKFEVPFDLKVVLSTNMQPTKLGDDAFFRRIHSKVFVGACSDTEFDEILRRVTEAKGIRVAEGAAEHLRYFRPYPGRR
ncbi:MAG: hypothetical protein M5U19_06550 [Microthrixaceae bacterium]|nr:hypothetical protein [Microthrixaceae bacterium]